MDEVRATLDVPSGESKAALPPRAELAWLEGRADHAIDVWREALAHDEAIDLYGRQRDPRAPGARAGAAGDIKEAAKVLAPVFERADARTRPAGRVRRRRAHGRSRPPTGTGHSPLRTARGFAPGADADARLPV
jgi:hypothetical protein